MSGSDLKSFVEATEKKLVAKEWRPPPPRVLKLLGFSIFALPTFLREQRISLRRYCSALALSLASFAMAMYAFVSPWVDSDPIQGAVHILMGKLFIQPIPIFQPLLHGAIGVAVWLLLGFALQIISRRLVRWGLNGISFLIHAALRTGSGARIAGRHRRERAPSLASGPPPRCATSCTGNLRVGKCRATRRPRVRLAAPGDRQRHCVDHPG